MSTFPLDIIRLILQRLSFRYAMEARGVCKKWRDIISTLSYKSECKNCGYSLLGLTYEYEYECRECKGPTCVRCCAISFPDPEDHGDLNVYCSACCITSLRHVCLTSCAATGRPEYYVLPGLTSDQTEHPRSTFFSCSCHVFAPEDRGCYKCSGPKAHTCKNCSGGFCTRHVVTCALCDEPATSTCARCVAYCHVHENYGCRDVKYPPYPGTKIRDRPSSLQNALYKIDPETGFKISVFKEQEYRMFLTPYEIEKVDFMKKYRYSEEGKIKVEPRGRGHGRGRCKGQSPEPDPSVLCEDYSSPMYEEDPYSYPESFDDFCPDSDSLDV